MKNDKINKRLINYILVLVFLILLVFFLNYTNILSVIKGILVALIPFYIGFFLSWVVTPMAEFLNKKFKIDIKIANFLALFSSIVLIVAFLVVVLPLALIQTQDLLKAYPEIWKSFVDRLPENFIITGDQVNKILDFFNINMKDLVLYIKDYLSVITNGISFIIMQAYNIVTFVMQIIFGYVIAFYFIGSIRSFVKGVINLIDIGDKEKNRLLILNMSKVLFSYIRGVFIVSFMIGFLITIGAYFIGIDAPVVFGIISGVTNVIPYLGPVLGGIPLFIVALSIGYQQAILVVILIIVVQFIESNFFQPKIMSYATNLHPVTIMVSLLVFGNMFGIVGMLVATPILSMFNVWLKQSKYADRIKI